MNFDDMELYKFIEHHKNLIHSEKKRLGCLEDVGIQNNEEDLDGEYKGQPNINGYKELSTNHENNQNISLVEPLDLSSCNEKPDKQAFIDIIEHSENPLTFRSHAGGEYRMLRYGEYSPNNPQLRVATLPYLGLGEYEQRRQFLTKQRQADYKDHILKKNQTLKNKLNTYFTETIPEQTVSRSFSKSVQTDIQNIHNHIVQYELHSDNPAEKELSPQPVVDGIGNMYNHSPTLSRKNQSLPNSVLRPESHKLKSILSTRRSDTARDVEHSYVPSILDGFSYQDRTEYLEKEKLKRELYQKDLQQQIEEKRRLLAQREERERHEQELENCRLELQLQGLQEQQYIEQYKSPRNNLRRTSEDFNRDESFTDRHFRKHADSESSLTSVRNTKVASHYSPPVSRRVPYSFNIPSTSVFANPSDSSRSESVNRNESRSRSNSINRQESLQRQDSLSHLDCLSIKDNYGRIPRRHSATQQDFTLLHSSPKLYRNDRSSCSKLDDTLPIPVLKAHSPVAKDLKLSVVVDSSKHSSSDAIRRLEDRWQIPAVQKNIITPSDPLREGQSRNVLTQLGAIRLQLQREQMRMDETLQKRGISQPKAV